jgi:hypothetical protein
MTETNGHESQPWLAHEPVVEHPLPTMSRPTMRSVRPDPIPNSAVKHSLADGGGCMVSAKQVAALEQVPQIIYFLEPVRSCIRP